MQSGSKATSMDHYNFEGETTKSMSMTDATPTTSMKTMTPTLKGITAGCRGGVHESVCQRPCGHSASLASTAAPEVQAERQRNSKSSSSCSGGSVDTLDAVEAVAATAARESERAANGPNERRTSERAAKRPQHMNLCGTSPCAAMKSHFTGCAVHPGGCVQPSQDDTREAASASSASASALNAATMMLSAESIDDCWGKRQCDNSLCKQLHLADDQRVASDDGVTGAGGAWDDADDNDGGAKHCSQSEGTPKFHFFESSESNGAELSQRRTDVAPSIPFLTSSPSRPCCRDQRKQTQRQEDASRRRTPMACLSSDPSSLVSPSPSLPRSTRITMSPETSKSRRGRSHNCTHSNHSTLLITTTTMCRLLSFLYCALIAAAATTESISAVNPESLHRVAEQLDTFMKEPIQALDSWQHFRLLGGFDDSTSTSSSNNVDGAQPKHNLLPSQREAILRYQFSFALSKQFKVYYGDEDGTFLAYDDFFVDASYREPRNSGYDISDPTMQHYYNACVNIVTGQPTTCNMQQGSPYISCVDDCQYVPCVDLDGGDDNEVSGDGGDGTSSRNPTAASNKIALCQSYEKRFATELDASTKGFVPRTYSCIDQFGQFTEQPGQAIQLSTFQPDADEEENYISDTIQNTFSYSTQRSFTLGDCTFRDGTTPVQRADDSGDFAYCANTASPDDPNCSRTFTGGYRSRDYDPRVRSWYEQVRSSQQPSWSNPYTFFTTLEMGITYGQPMYIQDDEQRKIFQGVMAVDYPLSGISDFLQQEYGAVQNSGSIASPIDAGPSTNPLMIAIAEDAAPHYLIGISTGRKTAQTVQKDDPSKPCPDNASSEECSAVRVSILQEFDILGQPLPAADDILRRAFQAQLDENFDESLLVPVPSGGSIVRHVSKSLVYEQDQAANLKWRIIVVFETVDDETDSLEPGNPLMAIVIVLSIIGFLLCMSLWIQFYKWRSEKAMIHADWRFTLAFLMGCAVMNLASFTALGPNTNANCMLRMWSFNGLFTVALAPLLVKVWRLYSLIGKSSGFTRKSISNGLAAAYTLPIVAAEVVLLLLFSFLDPPRRTVTLETAGLETIQRITCEQNSDAFVYAQFGFGACLVLAGCILAYLTRNLDPKFGEAKQLIFAMYNVAFTGIVIVGINVMVDISQGGELTMKVIGIFWGTLFSSSAFVLPRLMQVKESRQMMTMMGSSQSTTNGRQNSASSFRNNIYVSGIDLSKAVPQNPSERRSTYGSTRSGSEASILRRSVDAFRITPKIRQELSNLEEESEASAAESANNQVDRRNLASLRNTTRERSMDLAQVIKMPRTSQQSHSVSLISGGDQMDGDDNDLSNSMSSDEDYDKGGPQWEAAPDMNQELNRSCRLERTFDVSSSNFSVGMEGPRIQRLSQELNSSASPAAASPSSINANAGSGIVAGRRSRTKLRHLEEQFRGLHSQMESINEEADIVMTTKSGADKGDDSINSCDGEDTSGGTDTTVPNGSDCA